MKKTIILKTAKSILCRSCGAKPGEACTTPHGRKAHATHAQRITDFHDARTELGTLPTIGGEDPEPPSVELDLLQAENDALKAQLAAARAALEGMMSAFAWRARENKRAELQSDVRRAIETLDDQPNAPQPYASAPALLAACKEMLEAYAPHAQQAADLEGERCLHSAVIAARASIRSAEPTAPAKEYIGEPEMPWCEACRSYHVVPKTFEHWRLLQCFAPWHTEPAQPKTPHAGGYSICRQCGGEFKTILTRPSNTCPACNGIE